MSVGEAIREIRQRQDPPISIKDAAARGKVPHRYWYQLENDETSPTVKTLGKVAIGLGCELTDIFKNVCAKEVIA